VADRLTGPSILALVGRQQTGPDLWRVLQPITALEKQGYPAGWDFKDADLLGLVAAAAEAILIPRMEWPPEYRRVAEAWFQKNRQDGKVCIYDADDDIFTAAETQRRVELGWMEGRTYEQLEASRFERIWAMQQCDGVTVSTQRLATIVRSFTKKPVIVVPNAIDLIWFRGVVKATRRQIPGLTIGWAGGRRHDRDVEMMAEAWGRIARRYPAVRFVVQGHVPPVILENVDRDRLAILPWMRLEEYPYGIRQVDISCAAVADTPFNRAKSQIKVMEAAAAGSAVVASPFYAGLVDNGYSGFIAESVGEWEDALTQLVESNALRQMMARRLIKVVEKHHSLAGNLWRWPAAWSAIQESANERRIILGTGAKDVRRGVILART
jgi:glycosyltransferase involved in cell wall biosynthesis